MCFCETVAIDPDYQILQLGHMPPFLQSIVNTLLKSPITSLLIQPEVQKFIKFTDDLIAERVEQELNRKSTGSEEPELRDDFVRLFRDHEANSARPPWKR